MKFNWFEVNCKIQIFDIKSTYPNFYRKMLSSRTIVSKLNDVFFLFLSNSVKLLIGRSIWGQEWAKIITHDKYRIVDTTPCHFNHLSRSFVEHLQSHVVHLLRNTALYRLCVFQFSKSISLCLKHNKLIKISFNEISPIDNHVIKFIDVFQSESYR